MQKKDILEEYFKQLMGKEELIQREDIFGTRYIFSKARGNSFIRRVFLEKGIEITFCSFPDKFQFSFENGEFGEDILEFCFLMEGDMKIICKSSREIFYFSKNQVCLYYSKNQEKGFSFYNNKSKSFSIHIHLSYFESLFHLGKGSPLEIEWKKNIQKMLQEKFLRVWKASPSLQNLGREIMQSKFHSILDYFLFRTKVDTFLLKMMLEAMEIHDEKEEVLESLKILVEQDYSHCYTLEELSSLLNTPVHQLQKFSKEKKQMTVSQYIRKIKLQYAMKLLEREEYNIAEVAAMVGYENPSKFSRAFYKEFGENPKNSKNIKI